MESRIQRLEEFTEAMRGELRAIDVRLTRIETRLNATATKGDLVELSANMGKCIVGTTLGVGAVALSAFTFLLAHAMN